MASLLSLTHLTPWDHPTHPFSSWPSLPPTPIGRLSLLTPEITSAAAREEIITGQRFALDYTAYPSGALMYTRMPAEHKVFRVDSGPRTLKEAEETGKIFLPNFDCQVHINTQGTTQWDYFLHFAYGGSGLFYSGLTAEQIEQEDTGDYGVAAVAKIGGVQTRGILIDLPYYFESKGFQPLDPFSYPSSTKITLLLLQDALEFFKLTPRPGDVLLVRTGFEDALSVDRTKPIEEQHLRQKSAWAGVDRSKEVAEWIWKNGFVAVGSDNPTFEEWRYNDGEILLHMVLLAGMGIMIGELLKLNEVAAECRKRKRWSFFFSSTPLMVEHGVASPPNAVVIM